MSIAMTDTSVFTDDSGKRRRVVSAAVRAAVALLSLGAIAVAISIFGHVTLPGLDRPLHIPGIARSPAVAHIDTSATNLNGNVRSSTPGVTSSPAPSASATTKPASSSTTSASVQPSTPSATSAPPAVTSKSKTNGKSTAKSSKAAHPVHSPGNPPTVPPGLAKKNKTGKS